MTASFPTAPIDCCAEHDGPHIHGCQLERVDDVQHRGRCVTDPVAAARQAAAEEARLAAMPVPPRVAWLEVSMEDDSTLHRYPRPHVMQVIDAQHELQHLDAAGDLPGQVRDSVRVLLGVIGRLPADDMTKAFPPPAEPRRLSVVDTSGVQS